MGVFVLCLLLLLSACDRAATRVPASTSSFTDDAGHEVRLDRPTHRIVSLVPSVTETIIALGAGDRVVGRTEYDNESSLASVAMVGGGLNPSLETIVALKPDVVVVWASDARGDLRHQLEQAGITTIALAVQDTTDAYRVIHRMGQVLDAGARSDSLILNIRASLDSTRRDAAGRPRRRVFYVVYNDPPMTTGHGTFIDQLLDLAGADNVFADSPVQWPTVSLEEIVRRDPDLIVLPVGDGGATATSRLRSLAGWKDLRAVQHGCIAEVNADLASRPGPNMALAARRLETLVHDTCPTP